MSAKIKTTPTPWAWEIQDYSHATIQGPNGEYHHVLSVSPCHSCCERAKKEGDPKWIWGRCTCPSESDAKLIIEAVNGRPKLLRIVAKLERELALIRRKPAKRRAAK